MAHANLRCGVLDFVKLANRQEARVPTNAVDARNPSWNRRTLGLLWIVYGTVWRRQFCLAYTAVQQL